MINENEFAVKSIKSMKACGTDVLLMVNMVEVHGIK